VAGEVLELEAGAPFTATALAQFAEPWAISAEPGTGVLFITEKAGALKFFDPATGRVGNVSGIPKDDVSYGGQGGFAEVTFAPDYETSRTIYLSWVSAEDDGKRYGKIGMGTLSCEDGGDCAVEGLTEIWRQTPALESFGQFGLRITFTPDGEYMFVSSGDLMANEPAQDLTNNLGSMLRLMPDGSAAPGNPFASMGSPSDQVWSYGHRTPYGLEFDLDGQLWELEHGPRGGDEINKIIPGENYGWPLVSDGINYNGDPIPDNATMPEMHKPAITWVPVIAPGGLLFYRGDAFPDWRGEAVIVNLGTRTLVRVRTDAASDSATEVARYAFPSRLRGIEEDADGTLWVIEDGPRGKLLHLSPAE